MAREDFLGCLSKAWIEKVGSSLRILPSPRAKDTRAEVIKQAFSEVARHAPFSKRMRRVMGQADRSSRSMLLKAQADRFAVDLILDCEPRPAAIIRVTVTGRAGTRPHGGVISIPPPMRRASSTSSGFSHADVRRRCVTAHNRTDKKPASLWKGRRAFSFNY